MLRILDSSPRSNTLHDLAPAYYPGKTTMRWEQQGYISSQIFVEKTHWDELFNGPVGCVVGAEAHVDCCVITSYLTVFITSFFFPLLVSMT